MRRVVFIFFLLNLTPVYLWGYEYVGLWNLASASADLSKTHSNEFDNKLKFDSFSFRFAEVGIGIPNRLGFSFTSWQVFKHKLAPKRTDEEIYIHSIVPFYLYIPITVNEEGRTVVFSFFGRAHLFPYYDTGGKKFDPFPSLYSVGLEARLFLLMADVGYRYQEEEFIYVKNGESRGPVDLSGPFVNVHAHLGRPRKWSKEGVLGRDSSLMIGVFSGYGRSAFENHIVFSEKKYREQTAQIPGGVQLIYKKKGSSRIIGAEVGYTVYPFSYDIIEKTTREKKLEREFTQISIGGILGLAPRKLQIRGKFVPFLRVGAGRYWEEEKISYMDDFDSISGGNIIQTESPKKIGLNLGAGFWLPFVTTEFVYHFVKFEHVANNWSLRLGIWYPFYF